MSGVIVKIGKRDFTIEALESEELESIRNKAELYGQGSTKFEGKLYHNGQELDLETKIKDLDFVAKDAPGILATLEFRLEKKAEVKDTEEISSKNQISDKKDDNLDPKNLTDQEGELYCILSANNQESGQSTIASLKQSDSLNPPEQLTVDIKKPTEGDLDCILRTNNQQSEQSIIATIAITFADTVKTVLNKIIDILNQRGYQVSDQGESCILKEVATNLPESRLPDTQINQAELDRKNKGIQQI